MAETATTEQPKPFNSADFIAKRNADAAAKIAGKEPPKPAIDAAAAIDAERAAAAKAAEKEPDTLEEVAAHPTKLTRTARRELNRLRERAAMAEGRLAAYEELRGKVGENEKPGAASASEKGTNDPEPVRAGYATDAEFNRALGRWDARQESKKIIADKEKEIGEDDKQKGYQDHLRAMDEKATADIKLLPDWEEVAKAAEGEGSVEYVPEEHLQLLGMIAGSDLKAFVLYHFARHQDEFQKMLDLTKTPDQQIRAFHRLEGRIEKLYTAEQKENKVAPTSEVKTQEQGSTHPADADKISRAAAVDRDVHKPKPSAEVAARGGSAAPLEPAIGSKEWMAKRNQAQYAR